MAKKSKRKRKKAAKRDYEAFTYGPITLERQGRYLRYSSSMDKIQHREFKERLKSLRPEIKKKIQNKIDELSEIIQNNDPFELLSAISLKNCFTDAEAYSELRHEKCEYHVEYAISMVMGIDKPGFGNHTTEAIRERFICLVSEIFNDISWYYIMEGAKNEDNLTKDELRIHAILDYLFVRGASFPQHHIALVRDLFSPHDQFLKNIFNFLTEDLINCASEIENQINKNFNELSEALDLIEISHTLYRDFVEKNSFENAEKALEEFRALPEVLKIQKKLDNIRDVFQSLQFEIKPNPSAPDYILELISCQFGDNKNFIEFEKAPGWPGNDSIIYVMPLIKHDDKFYCFFPQLVYRNLINILETLIRQADQEYFNLRYQSKRAEYLENKALKYLADLMPGCKAYKKLYYKIVEDGEKKRPETDGLIIFDNNLFIIEGKAGLYSIQAKRGGIERIKKHASQLIDNAYSQALRTKKYIEDTQTPRFENKDGSSALEISQKRRIKNIFLINVTLESLGKLSTGLNSLKAFNLLQGKEWPWSVYLNDLRVVSEIIDSPSIFLTFLKRRLRANDFPEFQSADELDFLMFYLHDGLYLENLNKKMTALSTIGYTEPLDRYYMYLDRKIKKAKKPKLRTDPKFIELIRSIESLTKPDFTTITTTFLGFSGEAHKQIIEGLWHAKKLSDRDNATHDFTLYFKDESLGVTFFLSPGRDTFNSGKMEDFCKLKIYQTKMENWIGVAIDATKTITTAYDFFKIHKQWEYNAQLEQKLIEFKAEKWRRLGIKGKIGRNQPCPCGSGLKYKKCCR